MAKEIGHDDTIERTSIVTFGLLEQLHEVLADPKAPDDVTLGIIMGLSMFLDEKVGPFRAEKLMSSAPSIILKTDAHVARDQLERFMPVIHAFGDHLAELKATALSRQPEPTAP
ncbi:MAG TPA: hypothetical protein VED40_14230 [Azospirillaceae bacterium]|nr:hypothetical protein [Azospirillaceae bacterium]